MKQYWQRIAAKIDALSVRERTIIFVMAALILVVLVNMMLLDPQYVKQKKLSLQLQQDQAKIAEIRMEIQQKIKAHAIDPDAVDRVRLQNLKQQFSQMHNALLEMQKGLISPDKMAVLLEDILKRDGRLHLMSLKTLPVSSLNDAISADNKSVGEKATGLPATQDKSDSYSATGAIYKHGVEITVQGSYLDMVGYMKELETMPWQLFWGKAKLNVEEYPKATLTLTLFTMSLEKKWLNL